MTIYGLGVNLCNMRLIDNEIRFSSTKDEEWAQMDTKVGSTTNVDASKRKTTKPFSLWRSVKLSAGQKVRKARALTLHTDLAQPSSWVCVRGQ